MAEHYDIRGYRPDSRDFKAEKRSKALDYLHPKKGTGEALISLTTAAQELHHNDELPDTNCRDRQLEFSGYDDPGIPVPTDFQARVMCHGCPLFKLCEDYAKAAKPAMGVYGGKVYGRALIEAESAE